MKRHVIIIIIIIMREGVSLLTGSGWKVCTYMWLCRSFVKVKKVCVWGWLIVYSPLSYPKCGLPHHPV